MATATLPTSELDDEIQTLIPSETESTAIVLQGVVSMERIADSAAYVRIVSAGTDAATNIKSIKALFEPICAARFSRHKRATQLMAEKLKPFEEVKRRASQLIGAYDQEQERLRRAEETRLQREAEAESLRVAEEQRKLGEAEALRLSQERAIADALELEASGDHKGAEAVLNHPTPVPVYVPPVYVPPVVVQKTVPKVAGKSSVTNWEWRVRQSQKCHAPAAHKPEECSVCLEEVPRQYLILDTKTVGQLVRAMKDKTAIAGIEVYPASGARFKG